MAIAIADSRRTERYNHRVRVPAGTDLVEWYFEQGWTDGLPVVPPTRERVAEFVAALGGEPDFVECKVPPRHGSLTREVLAINMVMAGCKPEYAPVVRAAMLALTAKAFNLNGVQATTHMAAPLLIVNGPIAGCDRHERRLQRLRLGQSRQRDDRAGDLRLVLLNVGGGRPGDLDKSTWAIPANTPIASPRTRRRARGRPTMSKRASMPRNSTVFVLAAEPPHSVTNHVANDPEGILDSICSAMSTIANNNAVSSGHCAVIIGPEHARTIAGKGWTRHDVQSYLHMNAYNLFSRADLRASATARFTIAICRAGISASRIRASRSCPTPTTSICLSSAARPAGSPLLSPAGVTCRRRCCAVSKASAAAAREPICVDGTCYL